MLIQKLCILYAHLKKFTC